ncbi:hypothetical protein AALO_G00303080 [Alosa alosa]|uniref:Uncharacterized protein n=1 Tax=Alosa alosa TaxID=278164 RepID=A0AAV6FLW4_9TELE|nr:hypothetical protein AALO_G00303080 [Alosa alosa]
MYDISWRQCGCYHLPCCYYLSGASSPLGSNIFFNEGCHRPPLPTQITDIAFVHREQEGRREDCTLAPNLLLLPPSAARIFPPLRTGANMRKPVGVPDPGRHQAPADSL